MNIPVGKLLEQGLNLHELDFRATLRRIMHESFNGYIVVTAEGAAGIEEGLLLFREGTIVGAIFEYMKFNKILFGDEALPCFFNSMAAEFGVVDIGELARQQIELIVAFNEKVEISKKPSAEDAERMIASRYSESHAAAKLGEEIKKRETKYDVFKRIGLSSFKG